MADKLSMIEIQALLKADAAKPQRGVKKDPTAERTIANWFKQPVELEFWCENPDCTDTRTTVNACSHSAKFHDADCDKNCEQIVDVGRGNTIQIKGMRLCRYCFLAGVNA